MPLKSDSARSFDARLADVEAALARELRVSKALRDVGVALGTTFDLDQLLELILQKITEALEADRTTLYLLDESSDELVSRIAQGPGVRSIRLKAGHGLAGYVARTGKPLHVRDAYKDPRFNAEWDMLSGYRTRSILAAPMRNHLGKTIGVVQVLNKKRGDFTDEDADILAALATQAAVSIDNSRLFMSVTQKNIQLLDTKEQLEHRVHDLKLLFDLEHAMGRATSLEELFIAVLGEAMRACEAKMGAVALRDQEERTGALYIIDERAKGMRRLAYPEDAGLIGWAIRNDEALVSSDAESDSRRDDELDRRVGGGRLQLSRDSREREERLTTIGRLLSSVIHDLKTPLSVIGGYVQLMQSSTDAAQRRKFGDLVLKQFDLIGTMQREVLEFARGEKTILVRKVYVQKFFDDVRAQLEGELAKLGVELVVDVQERGTARFDEGKMLRVVHNLARNAAEAMGHRGGKFVIKVTRDKQDRSLVVSFSDTGPGIPREIEHRLFQSFVTSGRDGARSNGGARSRRRRDDGRGSTCRYCPPSLGRGSGPPASALGSIGRGQTG